MSAPRYLLVLGVALFWLGAGADLRGQDKTPETKSPTATKGEVTENVLKGLATVIGVIYTLAQIRAALPRSRNNLKADLEILSLVGANDPNRKVIEASIQRQINALYIASRESRFKIHNPEDFIFGVLCVAGFGTWTAFLVAGRSYYWAFFTGFWTLGGIGGIMNGFDPKKQKKAVAEKGKSQKEAAGS